MDMKPGLFQQQSLKLVMTKELTQAITLLQYSTIELTQFLREQSMENPLIEVKEINLYEFPPKLTQQTSNPIEYIGAKKQTLTQHLSGQLNYLANINSSEKVVITYLIDMLDENGYLHFSTNDIAEQLSVNRDDVEKAIALLQQLDPIGVCARNLQECLLLQIKQLKPSEPLVEIVIRDYFTLFANKSWKEIAKSLKINIDEIQKVHDFIQRLDPRPGSRFNTEVTTYIIPELKVELQNGRALVSFYDDYIPQLSINLQYYQQARQEADTAIKTYLDRKYSQYKWLENSLEQRKQTLQKVMGEIVRHQMDFFSFGPQYLQPLTMKEVAIALDIHESTVSRAARDKYVQTPFGIFELRSFFTSSIETSTQSATSSYNVKNIIAEIVEREDKLKPLSDQKIVRILAELHQIVVSRRTVAKYREQLGILSSAKRKRYN